MIEEQIKKIKKEYRSIEPPLELTVSGVDDLWSRIDNKPSSSKPFILILTGVVIMFSAGLVGAAQASKPDDPLYPVKVASGQIVQQLSKIIEEPFSLKLVPDKVENKNDIKQENNPPYQEQNEIKNTPNGVEPNRQIPNSVNRGKEVKGDSTEAVSGKESDQINNRPEKITAPDNSQPQKPDNTNEQSQDNRQNENNKGSEISEEKKGNSEQKEKNNKKTN